MGTGGTRTHRARARAAHATAATRFRARSASPPASRLSSPLPPALSPLGNRTTQRLLRTRLPTGLELSRPDGIHEREADRIAEEVLRVPGAAGLGPRTPGAAGEPAAMIGRAAVPDSAVHTAGSRRRASRPDRGAAPARGASPAGAAIAALGPGQPLDAPTRRFFEPRFGRDLGHVRVHTGGRAAESARELGARAYAIGRDVVFGAGRFSPQSAPGRKLLAHELAHVVQQDAAGPGPRRPMIRSGPRVTPAPPRIYRQPDGPRLRLPTLEVYSALHGGALGLRGTGLTADERADALMIFGASIDLDRVRIVETPVVNAPTTLGNNIRIAPGSTIPRHVLIHELAHVWQFQTKGTGYISDSIWHQTVATVTEGNRGAAYRVTIEPGKSIHRYTAEQQAVIIEDYFQHPALRADPEYARMLGEVRRSRPISMSLILEEAAFGPGTANRRRLPPTVPGGSAATPFIPQVRIEF
ncbi:MAG TPA: DUF4157 domain-containing protein [Longimicrobiales bacterium]